LRHLGAWNEKRRESARRYRELFGSEHEGVALPYEPSWSKAVYHLYILRVEGREQLQKHLGEANIGTGIHYPIALHLQDAYASLGYKKGDFPVSEKAAAEILSIPMFPGLGRDQQSQVVERVKDFVTSRELLAVPQLSSERR
jgi:dTDP-4-amino-4,6-dideoxygalactose transaminase